MNYKIQRYLSKLARFMAYVICLICIVSVITQVNILVDHKDCIDDRAIYITS